MPCTVCYNVRATIQNYVKCPTNIQHSFHDLKYLYCLILNLETNRTVAIANTTTAITTGNSGTTRAL